MKKIIAILLAALMLTGLLSGCFSSSGTSSSTSASSNGESGGKAKRLTIAMPSEMAGTIPWEQNDNYTPPVLGMVVEPLLYLDADGAIIPNLAESWEMIDDTHYRFKLREGVTFHNGNPFTAEDVLFTASQWNDAAAVTDTLCPIDLSECSIESDHSIILATDGKYPNFIATCAMHIASIVDKESYEADPESYKACPIGTGPFKFVEWVTGDHTLLHTNTDWWGGEIAFDELMFRVIPEASTRSMEIQSGGVDIAVIEITDVEGLKNVDGITVTATAKPQSTFLEWNCTKAPFDDINVRRAIKSAINMDELVNVVMFGLGEVSHSPVPPQADGYKAVEDPYPYDVEAAREYLAQSAYPDGFKTTLKYVPLNGYDRACALIQAYLAEIGIELEMTALDQTNFYANLTAENFDIAATGWSLGSMDAAEAMTLFGTATAGNPGTGNFNYFSDEKMDELLAAAKSEMNLEKRAEMYGEVQQIIADNVVMIPMYLGQQFMAYSNNVQNVQMLPNMIVNYQNVTFAE